jgi:hypothetical protein
MANKRKPTLKQIFNAWVKYQKKCDEKYKAEMFVRDLVTGLKEVCIYATELIEHEGYVYRITITNSKVGRYEVKRIASVSELPTKN